MQHEAHFIGQAGEYLVCAELTAKGYVCMPTPPKVKYDVIVDVNDRLLKLQVKTVNLPRKASKSSKLVYEFSLKKNRKKETEYSDEDIDGFALVAFNQRQIAYLPPSDASSMTFRVGGVYYTQKNLAKYMDDKEYTFESFLEKLSCTK